MRLVLSQNPEEADLLNVALFNCTAKDWREANPELAKKGMNIRGINELAILSNVEGMNAEMIRKGLSKKERNMNKINNGANMKTNARKFATSHIRSR